MYNISITQLKLINQGFKIWTFRESISNPGWNLTLFDHLMTPSALHETSFLYYTVEAICKPQGLKTQLTPFPLSFSHLLGMGVCVCRETEVKEIKTEIVFLKVCTFLYFCTLHGSFLVGSKDINVAFDVCANCWIQKTWNRHFFKKN